MASRTDSFGFHGAARPSWGERTARLLDNAVTLVLALVVMLCAGLGAYSAWDSWHVLNGGATLQRPSSSEQFAALREKYHHVVAWITVPGTGIDHPVVQGEDDFWYLSHDPTGASYAGGSIILDAACDPAFGEPYELLMGHHMEGHRMFGDLGLFADRAFFDEHAEATLLLPDRELALEVVAVMEADAYDGTVFGLPVTSQEDLASVAAYVRESAKYQRDFLDGDQLVALSTCASSGVNARTVVICRVRG